MAILNKTPLNSSDKHDLLLKTLSCQVHGDISLLAEEFNVSRKTVYTAKACANKAIQQVVEPSRFAAETVDKQQLIMSTLILLDTT